jgi:hypothetical protein
MLGGERRRQRKRCHHRETDQRRRTEKVGVLRLSSVPLLLCVDSVPSVCSAVFSQEFHLLEARLWSTRTLRCHHLRVRADAGSPICRRRRLRIPPGPKGPSPAWMPRQDSRRRATSAGSSLRQLPAVALFDRAAPGSLGRDPHGCQAVGSGSRTHRTSARRVVDVLRTVLVGDTRLDDGSAGNADAAAAEAAGAHDSTSDHHGATEAVRW